MEGFNYVPRPTGGVSAIRKFPASSEYFSKPVLKNPQSWAYHLKISTEEVAIFERQVKLYLICHEMVRVQFQDTEGREELEKLVRYFRKKRDDIFPRGHSILNEERSREIIKAIISRSKGDLRKEDKLAEVKADLEKEFARTSRNRGASGMGNSHELDSRDEDDISQGHETQKLRTVASASTGFPPRVSSYVAVPQAPASWQFSSAIAPSSSWRYQQHLSFDPERITIDVQHHTEDEWVATLHLERILKSTTARLDINDCSNIRLHRLQTYLQEKMFQPGMSFFNPQTEELLCTVEGRLKVVDDQVAFEDACSRNIAASHSADAEHRPSIKFRTRRRHYTSEVESALGLRSAQPVRTRMEPVARAVHRPRDSSEVQLNGKREESFRTGEPPRRGSSKRPLEIPSSEENSHAPKRAALSKESSFSPHEKLRAMSRNSDGAANGTTMQLASNERPNPLHRWGHGTPPVQNFENSQSDDSALTRFLKGKGKAPISPAKRNSMSHEHREPLRRISIEHNRAHAQARGHDYGAIEDDPRMADTSSFFSSSWPVLEWTGESSGVAH